MLNRTTAACLLALLISLESLANETTHSSENSWWKSAVVYQIYTRSFADSDDDGIGDLQGVISKLDYLERLGINVIWLTPFYPSPNVDFGYDIADYMDVGREYGTLADYDELFREASRREIRVIND